ncbi:nuclear pore complex protein NUP50A-like [Silene latifolia]|uniref:nuclear pore complex protein NUP50A-like n=1 Tax=Silene latifolia TaxID=37657 RepID=UPI003D78569F
MGDENQPSKKRAAGRELSRDDPGLDDEEDVGEQEIGTFKKASDEVLATRKIVKVRRQQTSTTPSAPTVNPFAGIRLVPPPPAPAPVPSSAEAQAVEDKAAADDPETKDDATTDPEEKIAESKELPAEVNQPKLPLEVSQPEQAAGDVPENVAEVKTVEEVGEKSTNGDAPANEKQDVADTTEKDDKNETEKTADSNGTPLNSFQQLSSSQNAFTGLGGTGFSSSAFSFGSANKDGSPSQSLPSFSFGTSTNGSTPLFGIIGTGSSIAGKTEGVNSAFNLSQDVPRETGEENEETVFSADSALFEFFEGGWKERGKGELKINVLKGETRKARLLMRAKGNLRLILNASLYPDLKLTKMEKKGVTFACLNSATEKKDGLSTFALKFKDSSIVEEFSSAVSVHKGKPSAELKTPENSPKATED